MTYDRNRKSAENNRKSFKKYYNKNKEVLANKKREYYLKNKEEILKKQKEYRDCNPKENNRKTGTGNYNITLAERNKEEWLNEELFLYKLKITDIDGTIFYKHGLAKNMRNRLYHIPYEVDVIEAVKMTKYDAIYSEREMLMNKIKYSPLIKFGGHTECFL